MESPTEKRQLVNNGNTAWKLSVPKEQVNLLEWKNNSTVRIKEIAPNVFQATVDTVQVQPRTLVYDERQRMQDIAYWETTPNIPDQERALVGGQDPMYPAGSHAQFGWTGRFVKSSNDTSYLQSFPALFPQAIGSIANTTVSGNSLVMDFNSKGAQ